MIPRLAPAEVSLPQSYIRTRASVHGFVTLAASGTTMTWTAFRADGSALETIAMPK